MMKTYTTLGESSTYRIRLTCHNCQGETHTDVERGTPYSWLFDVLWAGVKCPKCDTSWYLDKSLLQ